MDPRRSAGSGQKCKRQATDSRLAHRLGRACACLRADRRRPRSRSLPSGDNAVIPAAAL